MRGETVSKKGITWPGYAGEPRHFDGFPGIYGPDVVVPLGSTGMSLEEAKRRIAEGNLPLEIVDTKPATAKGGED
jgi:hypothetical protein